MAYHHAEGYRRLESCEIAAVADVVPENAEAFATTHDIPADAVYDTHLDMLEEMDLDIVSISVPPALHADITIDCIRAGVDAVHCEKPMDLTWGGSRRMAQEAWRRDVQLTFNHQRRFDPVWRRAKELIDEGIVGKVRQVATATPNLYDWGTHSLDLCGMYAGDPSPEWVLGNIDYREEQVYFGAHNENHVVAHWKYENDIHGLATTTSPGGPLVGCFHRIEGDEGEIRVKPMDRDAELIYRQDGAGWETDPVEQPDDWENTISQAIEHIVECVDSGEESELSARRALNGTELIFGTWESARRRGRVDFPLEIDDNPLEEMVESGALTPEPGGERYAGRESTE